MEDIKKVGVVGAGTMGFGIAINFALWGYPTTLSDLSEEILNQSMSNIRAAAALFVEEGLVTREQADDTIRRINATTELSEVAANSDFVTETIIERANDKRELFNKLDELCPPHAIIVSNTSSLMLSDFGSGVKRQDKIALTHYFAPPHIVPGVEVAKGPGTSDETFNITYDLMKKIGKVPIRVLKELPGYLLNRIQAAMREEAHRLWAEGVATAEDIELGVRSTFGFRLPDEGPMMHYDLAGIWNWPKEARIGMTTRQIEGAEPSPEVKDRIVGRLAESRPWFIESGGLEKALEKRDREFIRRLKQLYWNR